MKIFYTCKNEECEHEFEVSVTGGCAAKTYGLPEDCYPAESPDVEPTECPECNTEIDIDSAIESAHDAERDEHESYLEDKYEERKGHS